MFSCVVNPMYIFICTVAVNHILYVSVCQYVLKPSTFVSDLILFVCYLLPPCEVNEGILWLPSWVKLLSICLSLLVWPFTFTKTFLLSLTFMLLILWCISLPVGLPFYLYLWRCAFCIIMVLCHLCFVLVRPVVPVVRGS